MAAEFSITNSALPEISYIDVILVDIENDSLTIAPLKKALSKLPICFIMRLFVSQVVIDESLGCY